MTATSADVRTQISVKSVIIMIKECQICGKEFNARTSRYINCSPECAQISHNRMAKSEFYKIRAKMNHRKNHPRICLICNKPIPSCKDPEVRESTSAFHDRCTVLDMIHTINSGQMYTKKQKCRVCSRGYLISDIRQWAKMYAADGNTKRFEELL